MKEASHQEVRPATNRENEEYASHAQRRQRYFAQSPASRRQQNECPWTLHDKHSANDAEFLAILRAA